MNNYNLRTVIHRNSKEGFRWHDMKADYDRCDGISFKIMCSVLKHIQSTITVKIYDILVTDDEIDKPQGQNKDIFYSKVDFSMSLFFLTSYWKVQGYPIRPDSIKMISLKELGNNNLFPTSDWKFWIFCIICCSVSVFAITFMLNESIPSASLEFVRMLVSSSSLKEPRDSFRRVLLVNLIVALFALSSFIQSRLSALEIVQQRISTIDSVEDLIESNHKIYGSRYAKELLSHIKELENRYHIINDPGECTDKLLKGDHVVCVNFDSILRYQAQESAFIHISIDSLVESSLTYTFSEDTPLLLKMNEILLRMNDGGLIGLVFDREKRFYVNYENNEENKFIIQNLSSILFILCVGCLCGVCSFFIEISVSKLQKFRIKVNKAKE